MIDPQSQDRLKQEITTRMVADRALLDQLRDEIRPLRNQTRRIQPRSVTSISLVGTDGGNNKLQFDPFMVQIIRVVDSSNNEYCLEAITPTTDIDILSRKQFNADGTPATALGAMMAYLGVSSLYDLSPAIRRGTPERPISPTWVQVYRELVEWAILFSIVRRSEFFGTDTLIVFDGLLRSKMFASDLFQKYRKGLQEAVETQYSRIRRRIYIAGLAKHSQVLTRYRLAMALEQVMTGSYPAYVEIPRDIEAKAYVWPEYARDVDTGGEVNKFVSGKMFFAKFGSQPRDPIWPVDIFLPQKDDAQIIIGSLFADAINGFPVPFYPLCLQRAHENAALVDFDYSILQDQVFDGIRAILGADAPVLDVFRLQDADPSRQRYE